VFVDPEVVLDLVVDVAMARRAVERADMGLGSLPPPQTHEEDVDEHDEEGGDARLEIVLQDVYIESIWGSRLRMHHLQSAATRLGLSLACLDRVVVQGRCERIWGGDRF